LEFNLANIPSERDYITKEFILSKLTPKQIVEYYLNLNLKFNNLICSPFREDKNPSFGLKVINNYDVIGTDFAIKEHYDCFKIVSLLNNNASFIETLKIIANDFNLCKFSIDKSEVPLVLNTSDTIKPVHHKNLFTVEDQEFTRVDLDYWNTYRISISTLVDFDVYSCKRLWSNGKLIKRYSVNNPIYAYKFNKYKDVSYKIYCPFADKKNKWLFNGSSSDIEGFDQLPLLGDLLIITKSLKDVMCIKEHNNIPAISLQGEGNVLDLNLFNKLKYRFNTIYSLYDNDIAGIKGANKLERDYGIKPLYIPEESKCKDFAEYCSKNTYDNSVNLLNSLINNVSQ
jgi:hypothetical protein